MSQALVQVDGVLGQADGERDRLAHGVEVVQFDDVLSQQGAPGGEHLGVPGVRGSLREDVVHLVAALRLGDDVLDRNVLGQLVADDRGDLPALDPPVGHLVTDEEKIAALATPVVAVDRGVAGHEVQGQFVGFGFLPAATAFDEDVAEMVVHPVVGLELADLQGHPVAGGGADRAEENLRVVDVSLADEQAEQVGQLALQGARHPPHRAGHVEQDADGQRGRVLVAVAALARPDAVRVEAGVGFPAVA